MKKSGFYIVLTVVLAAFLLSAPAFFTRVYYENNNRHAVLSVKCDGISDLHLSEYKESGVKGAVISENETGGFSEELILNAKNLGLEIYLSLDCKKALSKEYAEYIEGIIKKYCVKYINVYSSDEKHSSNGKNPYLCSLIEKNKLILVLTETKTQLSNDCFPGFDDVVQSAGGRALRGYNSDKRNSLNKADYDLNYFQMLNSLVDRNIRFFMVRTIEDREFDDEFNTQRTLRATKRFSKKLEDMGYTDDFKDFSGYSVNRRLTSVGSAALMAVMAFVTFLIIFGYKKYFSGICIAVGWAFGFVAFFIPGSYLWIYPFLYAVISPCFLITVMLWFIIKMRKKLSCFKLCISGAGLAFLIMAVCAFMMCALLSGFDYFMNINLFRGVKVSLIFPVIYASVLFFFAKGENNTVKMRGIKELILKYFKKRYIVLGIAVFALAAVAVFVYIKRSGNNVIPFGEAYIRNAITDLIYARPRTKEVFFAWPCFILFLYTAKKFPDGILQWIFASVSGMLFASVTNTFCHVFTGVFTMYQRTFYGFLASIPVTAAFVFVSFLIIKLIYKIKH